MACLKDSGIQESSFSTTNLATCARSLGGRALNCSMISVALMGEKSIAPNYSSQNRSSQRSRFNKMPLANGAAGTRATHLRRGYVVPGIDGQTERPNGAFGKSDIEGKAAMGSGERAGNRTSFKWAGTHESTWATSEFQSFRSLDATPFSQRTAEVPPHRIDCIEAL